MEQPQKREQLRSVLRGRFPATRVAKITDAQLDYLIAADFTELDMLLVLKPAHLPDRLFKSNKALLLEYQANAGELSCSAFRC